MVVVIVDKNNIYSSDVYKPYIDEVLFILDILSRYCIIAQTDILMNADRYTRRPLSVESSELLLTPLLCYYLTAILVILPRTFPIRLSILPITLFYAFVLLLNWI